MSESLPIAKTAKVTTTCSPAAKIVRREALIRDAALTAVLMGEMIPFMNFFGPAVKKAALFANKQSYI